MKHNQMQLDSKRFSLLKKKIAGCCNYTKMKKKHVPLCADVCEVSRNKVEGEHMGSSKQPDALNSAVQKFIFRVTTLSLTYVKKTNT